MSKILQEFGAQYCKEEVPELKPGYLIKVHSRIKEGSKVRTQVFQGTVIATNHGFGVDETFTVRKISEGIGVERVFPIHSPNIIKIEVLRAHKVRRAKLNYLRDLSGKALRLKEVPLKLKMKKFAKPEPVSASADATANKKTDESVEASAKTEEVKSEAPKAEATADKKAE